MTSSAIKNAGKSAALLGLCGERLLTRSCDAHAIRSARVIGIVAIFHIAGVTQGLELRGSTPACSDDLQHHPAARAAIDDEFKPAAERGHRLRISDSVFVNSRLIATDSFPRSAGIEPQVPGEPAAPGWSTIRFICCSQKMLDLHGLPATAPSCRFTAVVQRFGDRGGTSRPFGAAQSCA